MCAEHAGSDAESVAVSTPNADRIIDECEAQITADWRQRFEPMTPTNIFRLKRAQVPRLTERDVTKQICDFLQLRGWKVIRLHSGLIDLPYERDGKPAKLRIGEQGMCDWIAVNPVHHHVGKPEVIFFEVKRPGGRPSKTKMVLTKTGKYRRRKGQLEYLRDLDLMAFCCGWFDSLEGFRKFYRDRIENRGPDV